MEKLIIAAAFMLFPLALVSSTPGTANRMSQWLPDIKCTLGQNGSNPIGSIGKDPIAHIVYASKANSDAWDNGAACGKIFCVVCTGSNDPIRPSPCKKNNYIFITVNAYCPDCETTFSIFERGFSTIAEPYVGPIKIEYATVQNTEFPCA